MTRVVTGCGVLDTDSTFAQLSLNNPFIKPSPSNSISYIITTHTAVSTNVKFKFTGKKKQCIKLCDWIFISFQASAKWDTWTLLHDCGWWSLKVTTWLGAVQIGSVFYSFIVSRLCCSIISTSITTGMHYYLFCHKPCLYSTRIVSTSTATRLCSL